MWQTWGGTAKHDKTRLSMWQRGDDYLPPIEKLRYVTSSQPDVEKVTRRGARHGVGTFYTAQMGAGQG